VLSFFGVTRAFFHRFGRQPKLIFGGNYTVYLQKVKKLDENSIFGERSKILNYFCLEKAAL
jgi:hypothetical protein